MTKVKRIQRKVLVLLFLGFNLVGLQAQQTTLTAGGEATGSGGSVCHSIGQLVYTSHSSETGSIEQGVQLPYEIFVVSVNEQASEIDVNLSVFPNPTSDYLTLQTSKIDGLELSFQMYNSQGEILQKSEVASNMTQINMSTYVPSTYFIKIFNNNKPIKTFKIIKK